jgi:WD40 repeat protein
LWAVEKDSGKTMPLTQDTFKVLNFDASRNGEFIIFSAFNDQRGLDLWQINRTGGKAVLVLQCGVDRCSSPAIAPDNRHIAYVREAAGPTPDIPYGAPRIRVLDMQNKQDVALFEDQQIIGIEPAWSPDGTRLASFDGSKQEFRLLDLASSSQATIPSQLGNSIAWSADGSTFVYTDLVTNEFGTHSRIREAKLDTNEIMTLFGDADERDYRYNSLAFSPAADLLVIGLQPNDKDPSEALWLIHLATLDGQSIADQPGYVYDSPAWDLWGSAVIFQQFKLKGGYTPEIGLWTPDMQQPRVLAEGTLPEWLP